MIAKRTVVIGISVAASLVFLYVVSQRIPTEASQTIPQR